VEPFRIIIMALIGVGSRQTSTCLASIGVTPGPSDAYRGGVTPQTFQLGLTPPTTEGLHSTLEPNSTNLEGTETATDDFEQTNEEHSTNSSFTSNDAAKSQSVPEKDNNNNVKLLDKCTCRRCMDKCTQKDLVTCASVTCNKKIHSLCFAHYVATNVDFPMKPSVVYCAAKACCAKFKLGNQGATT
jgi:hypothetical protein